MADDLGDLGSHSDLDTLRRSGRGKLILLGALIVAAAGAAAYTFTRKSGTGNPEEAGRVFVVTRGTSVGYSSVLGDLGFEAKEGTLLAFENKAKDEVPDLEGKTGLAAVFALADRFGWGYVAIEDPGNVDFSGLEIEGGTPSFAADAKWAVLSVGDFAFPHRLTVNPPPSKVMRGVELPLLGALFEQEKLAVLRQPDKLAVAELQLRDRLKAAVEKLEQIPEAEQLAERIVGDVRKLLVDDERLDPKPALIGDPLESGDVYPLPDGRILGVTRSIELYSRDAIRGELKLGGDERFLVGAAVGEPSARTPCAGLAGGAVAKADLAGQMIAEGGSAVALDLLSEGEVVWRWDAKAAAADAGGCGFVRQGVLPKIPRDGGNAAALSSAGKVATVRNSDGAAVVTVRAPGGDQDDLGLVAGADLQTIVWLDDDHLATLATLDDGTAEAILLLSVADPMKVLAIPGSAFGVGRSIDAVVAVPGKPSLVAVVEEEVGEERLARLDLPASYAELFAKPPADPSRPAVALAGQPTLITLDPSGLSVTTLAARGVIWNPKISADGHHVVFAVNGSVVDKDGTNDDEIAIADVAGKGMKILTSNALRDRDPYFTVDGRHIVFATRVEIPRTNWVITVPRVIAAP